MPPAAAVQQDLQLPVDYNPATWSDFVLDFTPVAPVVGSTHQDMRLDAPLASFLDFPPDLPASYWAEASTLNQSDVFDCGFADHAAASWSNSAPYSTPAAGSSSQYMGLCADWAALAPFPDFPPFLYTPYCHAQACTNQADVLFDSSTANHTAVSWSNFALDLTPAVSSSGQEMADEALAPLAPLTDVRLTCR
jgi:hypothetical protein